MLNKKQPTRVPQNCHPSPILIPQTNGLGSSEETMFGIKGIRNLGRETMQEGSPNKRRGDGEKQRCGRVKACTPIWISKE